MRRIPYPSATPANVKTREIPAMVKISLAMDLLWMKCNVLVLGYRILLLNLTSSEVASLERKRAAKDCAV
jgi:hypothetical protein